MRPACAARLVSAPISVDLPTPGGPGEADDLGPAGVRVDLADELPALGAVVLDERDRARERATVAVEQALGERWRRPSSAQSSQGPARSRRGAPLRLRCDGRCVADPPPSGRRTYAPSDARGDSARRRAPAPLHGGPLALLRFMRANRMLNRDYARLLARYVLLKLRYGGRLQTDGICFICPGVKLEIGRSATLRIGRWAWIGHGSKIRVHEGEVSIGAKTVIGQECTISAYQHVSIGRECIIADRVMLIDFDHGVTEVERPIRAAGHLQARRARRPQRLDRLRRVHPARGDASATTASSARARWSPRTCPRTPSSPARRRA